MGERFVTRGFVGRRDQDAGGPGGDETPTATLVDVSGARLLRLERTAAG